ncbi:hypothetical protein MUN77_01455 [Leucobacter allii]|uniref:hypothetical protein n=1 Tax=Leucobacter allii TaxID=2932247 RepID=UPI001FCF8D71|nr:hypothetical protein [Leucobacter allii]UOR02025.1 hypothetical protein MUN77_01455 [Leucobacter allii]
MDVAIAIVLIVVVVAVFFALVAAFLAYSEGDYDGDGWQRYRNAWSGPWAVAYDRGYQHGLEAMERRARNRARFNRKEIE